jgi:hypothetical protein
MLQGTLGHVEELVHIVADVADRQRDRAIAEVPLIAYAHVDAHDIALPQYTRG